MRAARCHNTWACGSKAKVYKEYLSQIVSYFYSIFEPFLAESNVFLNLDSAPKSSTWNWPKCAILYFPERNISQHSLVVAEVGSFLRLKFPSSKVKAGFYVITGWFKSYGIWRKMTPCHWYLLWGIGSSIFRRARNERVERNVEHTEFTCVPWLSEMVIRYV